MFSSVYVNFIDGKELYLRTNENDQEELRSWLKRDTQSGFVISGQGESRTQEYCLIKNNIKYVLFTN